MVSVIKGIFYIGPLLFAFGFIAPLCMQIVERTGWVPPFGLSALATGLIIAAIFGIPAQLRGRWV